MGFAFMEDRNGILCWTGRIAEADSDLHRRSNRKDRTRGSSFFRSGGDRDIHQIACAACRPGWARDGSNSDVALDGAEEAGIARGLHRCQARQGSPEDADQQKRPKRRIENGRCKGVQLANRIIETLLCAGAIDSPRILMLSGIGPADHISSFGIGVAVDLPDVGNHLEDHLLLAGVAYSARQEVPRSHYNHADAMLYVPNRDPDDSPDILIMSLSIPFVLPSVGKLAPPAYVLVPCLMKPRSRGSVRLASADTFTPALIDPNYLEDAHDRDVLVEGIRLAREIGSTTAFADWQAAEVYPGPRSVRLGELHTLHLARREFLSPSCRDMPHRQSCR